MPSSSDRRTPRIVTLLVVVILHGALLAMFLRTKSSPPATDLALRAVALMVLPATREPTVIKRSLVLRKIRSDLAVAPAPPTLDWNSGPAESVSSTGAEPLINWTAEAHRAIEAFEIRRDHPSRILIGAGSTVEGGARHHAGERSKTANGDWIVWINGSCYEIASWHPGMVSSTGPPQTICVPDPVPAP